MRLMINSIVRQYRRIPPAVLDLIILGVIYSAYCIYSITTIPQIIIPPEESDPHMYAMMAKIISVKGLFLKGFPVYFFSPLYGYFMYCIDLLTPNSVIMFRVLVVLQCLIFFVSIFVFKKIVAILVDNQAGRMGMYLYALYPPFIFYSVIPVKDIVTVALLVITIYWILRFIDSGKIYLPLVIGVLTGCMIHMRGTVALLIPLIMLVIYKRGAWRSVSIFFAAVVVCIIPFSLRNYFVAGEPVLLTPISGIHAYIGNNEYATGIYNYVKGVRTSSFGHFFDAARVAQEQTGKKMSARQVNAYWKQKARKYLIAHPLQALWLYVKKMILLVHYQEIPNNYCFEQFKHDYSLFAIINFPYNFTLLVILGVLGFISTQIKYKPWLLTAIGIFAVGTMAVFIVGRYRLPLAIFFMIGATGLIYAIREHRCEITKTMVCIAIMICIAGWYPSVKESQEFFQEAQAKARKSKKLYDRYGEDGFKEYDQWRNRRDIKYIQKFTDQRYLK